MILSFKLSMPGCSSWNGRWTGEGRLFVKIINLGNSKKALKKGEAILASNFHYDFGDGWVAGVSVEVVAAREAALLRRKSVGFAGYDWMVEEILSLGRIRTLQERQIPIKEKKDGVDAGKVVEDLPKAIDRQEDCGSRGLQGISIL